MKLPEEIRAQLLTRWRNGHRQWLADSNSDSWPLSFPLDLPTEAEALTQRDGLVAWSETWRRWPGPGEVQWCERRWRTLGFQRLPEKLLMSDPDTLAVCVGEADRWHLARERYAALTGRWPALGDVLPRWYQVLADEPEADFQRLCAMLGWLIDHPASGLYPRQIPVPGVDSKWLERRVGVLRTCLAAIRGLPADADAARVLGLRTPPHTVRMFILDADTRRRMAGLRDLTAPLEDLAQLDLDVGRVLVVENLQSALALPDLAGTVAFAALGKGVTVLRALPWIDGAIVDYWSDIDTHGFHMLHLVRSQLPNVRSLLMDEATLLAHRDTWVSEDHPYPGDLAALDTPERALFTDLKQNRWGQNVRLEQERIRWDWVLGQLQESLQ